MDKCSYDRFEGRYNPTNGNVWFFGKCFNTISEVVKIVKDVPPDYDNYIEINGLTCFIKSQTGQVWLNFKTFDNTVKASKYIHHIYTNGSGKTKINRSGSSQNLEFLCLSDIV